MIPFDSEYEYGFQIAENNDDPKMCGGNFTTFQFFSQTEQFLPFLQSELQERRDNYERACAAGFPIPPQQKRVFE